MNLRSLNIFFLIFLCLSWRLSFGSESLKKPMTLSEAIDYALVNSPLLDSATKSEGIQNLEYQSAIAKLLPSLDFSATHGLQNNIPISSNYTLFAPNSAAPWFSAISLGLTENLYDNGVSFLQLSIARKNQELAKIKKAKVRASLILAVSTEFYNYSLLTALVHVKERQVETLEKQFKFLSSQYEQGLKPRLDFLRFKAQVQRAEIDKTTAQRDQKISENNLLKLLSSSPSSLAGRDLQFEPVAISRDTDVSSLLPTVPPRFENFYDYKISLIQRELNDQNVAFAQKRYWPQILIAGGLTYSNYNYLNSNSPFSAGNQLNYAALITIQYNFWDWGIRKRDVQVAEMNREIQNNNVNLNLIDVRFGIRSVMADLTRIKSTYALTQELLKNEELNFKNIEEYYREGKSTYLDLITSLSNVLDAKVQFYSAYFDALQLLIKYRFYEGSLDENQA